MATAKKPAKAAQRKALTQAPAPRGAVKAVDTEGNVQDISGASPAVGIDPRTVDGAVGEGSTDIPGGGYVDANGGLHAAPPTPTRESAATANDAPGAGGSLPHPAPRRTLLEGADTTTVKVKVHKPFRLTDAGGVEHVYDETVTEMPKDHAEHWYARAHNVEVL